MRRDSYALLPSRWDCWKWEPHLAACTSHHSFRTEDGTFKVTAIDGLTGSVSSMGIHRVLGARGEEVQLKSCPYFQLFSVPDDSVTRLAKKNKNKKKVCFFFYSQGSISLHFFIPSQRTIAHTHIHLYIVRQSAWSAPRWGDRVAL